MNITHDSYIVFSSGEQQVTVSIKGQDSLAQQHINAARRFKRRINNFDKPMLDFDFSRPLTLDILRMRRNPPLKRK